MKRSLYIFAIIVSLFSYEAKGQGTVTSATSCLADTLTASFSGMVPIPSGITYDDGWSDVIPIGFTFTFYGVPYTQCIIGSNGCVGFDVSYALAYNTWPISSTLTTSGAGATDMHNLVAGPWCDVYVVAGGSIMYSTTGTAPNRKFEATWCGAAMYSCTTQWLTTQIILYETSNNVEVHIGHHTFCTSWNGGYAEVGVVKGGGTAVVAPGRDFPSTWNATNEAWRFTPTGASYTCSSIPYAPIPYASSAVYWYDSSTHTYLGTGTTLTVTPSVTTTYEAVSTGCNDSSFAYITVGPVGTGSIGGGVPHISAISGTNTTGCGNSDGTITLHGIKPGQIDTVFETIGGVPQPPVVMTAGTDSLLNFTGLPAGTYTFYVKVGPCPSNTVSITITTKVLAISSETFTNPTLCGKCDGSITLHGLWPGYTATIAYNMDGTPQTFTGVVATDSSLTLSGLCARYPLSNYTSFVATIGVCSANGTPITLTSPTISDSKVDPTICGKNDGLIKLYNLPPDSIATVTYIGGLGSPSTLTVATNDTLTIPTLGGGTYTSIIATINIAHCPAPNMTLTPPPISATFVNPTICGKNDGEIMLYTLPADSVFHVTFSGPGLGSGSYLTVGSNDTLVIPSLIAGPVPSSYTSIVATINGTECILAGSITLTDPAVNAQFDTSILLGCRGDLITVTSSSTPAGYNNFWRFGDGSSVVSTTATTTTHTYNDYPSYIINDTVTLVYQTYLSAPYCVDSIKIFVPINHTIAAQYSPTVDTVCLFPASPISFTNTSFGLGITSLWQFGNGSTSSDVNPTYTYTKGGNYITSLTVTDYLGCDSTVYGTVDVIKVDIKSVTHDTTVCLVEPMELIAHPYAIPGTFTKLDYAWTPTGNLVGNTNDTITYFMGVGDFSYTITVTTTPLGCQASDVEVIHSLPPLVLTNVTASQTIPYGSKVQLNANGADYYTWVPADGSLTNDNINNPIATPHDSTTYTVYGMSVYGCKDSAKITITIDYASTPFIPSGFTPNGDGLNDKFKVTNLKYQKLVDMKVFNRWGVEMYHTMNGDDGWDGTFNGVPQDLGVYNYVIILAKPDGTNQSYTGTVTLIR